MLMPSMGFKIKVTNQLLDGEVVVKKQGSVVKNSRSEWEHLKYIVDGVADNCEIPPSKPTVDAKLQQDNEVWDLAVKTRLTETSEKANERLDNFTDIIRECGFPFDSQTVLDCSQLVRTPDWEAECMCRPTS